jgi:hypothetical protein
VAAAERALQLRAAGIHAAQVAWLLAPLLGCAADGGASADAGAPDAELGQGELAFAPLAEDEALPYVAGSQGGHHVFVSFRVHGLNPMRVHVRVTTRVEDRPELDLTREGRVNFQPETPDATRPASYVYAGWPAQILMAPCHVGERAQIAVTLTDLDMRSVDLNQTIRIAMGSGPTPAACNAP